MDVLVKKALCDIFALLFEARSKRSGRTDYGMSWAIKESGEIIETGGDGVERILADDDFKFGGGA